MQNYVGTKLVSARPLNRAEYNSYRGWVIPDNENPLDEGYLVEYKDGGKPNDDRHEGYISWSPKEQFDNAYRLIDCLTFGLATELLKKGFKLARKGWNGKGQWVILMPGLQLLAYSSQEPGAKVFDSTAKHIGVDTPLDVQPYFSMWNAQGKWQPGWVPSVSDVLAEDWYVIE